ncbi:PPK2 family polyphosphate:nucleotide phosphotransferase [Algoriphagus boseongensis]|uniref:PPK2 family polyphosphate:nucleotide phosphotransferase n=1 Tax=Algoriphagus boseongensis TaxID=1442587 RepID=A0A4R6T267_9BACT|nr:polyphosphate kinase 2 family protein [Algoriphagus boseongensis]TDQ16234.1 PPK2 family polyphosphate:nucleotide phosphotransferase [Algoriphagus boseongensis]
MLENDRITVDKLKKMSDAELIKRAKKMSKKYCVGDGKKFKLKDYSSQPKMTFGPEDKPMVKEALDQGIEALAELQEILYAQDKWSLLLIFQAMDAAGKDGAIKHVLSGVNPQGCQVSSFKAPSAEELDHDFLWRCIKELPERGRIGIFNRSYYEEVLVVRVHEGILNNQKLPEKLISKKIWDQRLEDIRNFEKYLHRNGTKVIKIFLNVSKEEQKKRFLERIDEKEKNWKFSSGDVKERGYWDQYMKAYEDAIRKTSTKESPWYVVPADNKSYARIAVASAIIQALDEMDLAYPTLSLEEQSKLQEMREVLMNEGIKPNQP